MRYRPTRCPSASNLSDTRGVSHAPIERSKARAPPGRGRPVIVKSPRAVLEKTVGIEPPDLFGLTESAVTLGVLLALLAVALGFTVALYARGLAGARGVAASRREPIAPTLGCEGVFAGTVELEADDTDRSAPVRVEIHEHRTGMGRVGNRPVRNWSGTVTKPIARPFVLRLASGEPVTVVPRGETALADALDETVPWFEKKQISETSPAED